MANYKQIFKATSIFGGVQVITIIVNLIKSKLIAVILGPAGIGINGLINSTLTLVSTITNLGLSSSAVKNVANAFGTGDMEKVAVEVGVLRKLVWLTGLLGTIVVLVLAPTLSVWATGNKNLKWAFYIVSCTLLFNQLSSGQKVLLQGTRKISDLAKTSVWGAIIGLVLSLPLYFYFKEIGIALSILFSSIISLLFSYIYSKRILINAIAISRQLLFNKAKEMVALGFFLSISNLAATGFSYLFRIYLSNQGSLVDVGFYNAGFAIVGTYVGLVFTAMATDYFPRLASVANDNQQCTDEINQQLEMALIILSPILCGFIFYIDWALLLLYSNEFGVIRVMSIWAAYAVYFKAASWSIAYLFLAKGASRLYFINEIITHFYLFILNVVFYKFWGLSGVGVSYLIGYILHFIQMWIVARIKFDFYLTKNFIRIFVFQLSFGTIALLMSLLMRNNLFFYILSSILFLIVLITTFRFLDKRIQIWEVIRKRISSK